MLPADRLSIQEHQAIDLARRLRHQLGHWLAQRGITTTAIGISPYVDPAGRRSVVIRMNACAAHALLNGTVSGVFPHVMLLAEPTPAPSPQVFGQD